MAWKGFENATIDPETGKLVVPGQAALAAPKRQQKFNAQRTTLDGITFDSKREAEHWMVLKAREAAGEISGLRRQVEFELTTLPRNQREATVHGFVVVSRYRADFQYYENGKLIVADSKGVKTQTYQLKKRHMKAEYGIEILEV